MNLVPAELTFSVADGEGIEVAFRDGDLTLRFTDWREQPVQHCFVDTLAFRWSAQASVPTPRDDEAYQLVDSSWLSEEVRAEVVAKPEDFAHYVLCFNAAKVLEVISRKPQP